MLRLLLRQKIIQSKGSFARDLTHCLRTQYECRTYDGKGRLKESEAIEIIRLDFHLTEYSARKELFQPSDWLAEKGRHSKVETHSTFAWNRSCKQRKILAIGIFRLVESRLKDTLSWL